MMKQLTAMLTGMHLPAATVSQVGALMSGHATNTTTANLMSMLSPSARAVVMNAMPVSAGQVVVGAILHFAFAAFLGVLFAAVIAAAGMLRVPLMAFVPQIAFFLAHLLFGLVVGVVLAVAFRRRGMLGASPAGR